MCKRGRVKILAADEPVCNGGHVARHGDGALLIGWQAALANATRREERQTIPGITSALPPAGVALILAIASSGREAWRSYLQNGNYRTAALFQDVRYPPDHSR